jgi:hypothetical protein
MDLLSYTLGKKYADQKFGSVNGGPKGVYATLAALQTAFATGDSNNYLVAADGKWYYWSGSAWTAGGQYLSTGKVALQYDFGAQVTGQLTYLRTDLPSVDGQVLKSADGTVTTSGAFNATLSSTTDYFPVAGYTHINALIMRNYGLAVAPICFYDDSNTFKGFAANGNTVSTTAIQYAIPAGATKARYSYYTDAQATTLSAPVYSSVLLVNQNALATRATNSESNITTLQNRFQGSRNLFSKSAAVTGFQLNGDGTITADATKGYTDYIAVATGDDLYGLHIPSGGGALVAHVYDTNKTRIAVQILNLSLGQKNTISTASAAFIRITFMITALDTLMISKTPITHYEPFTQIDYTRVSGFSNGARNWHEGKNGDSLGDSLTGQGFFQKYVRQYFNLAKFSNHGIGGTKLSGAANGSGDSLWMDSRINSLDADADFITVLGGQNDGTVSMGALTLENSDTNTYAGALNALISKLYYKYQKLSAGYYAGITYTGVVQVTTAKNIFIYLCTPFYVPSETDPYRTKTMANAVREIAKLWGIPVIDLAAKSGLNDGVKDVYWTTDRTHPLEPGHSDRIAPVMIGEIERFKPVDFTKAYYV